MSYVRLGRQQQHPKGKKTVRPKKTAPPRNEWVSTVNDLSVHKLTPAELSHRQEMMKSHNKVTAQWELREKALKRRLRHRGSPLPLDQTSLSIIREVLSDQMMLQDVLARSDRTMAVVKDIFGDAPRRQTGHPSVTMAPDCDSHSGLPVFQRPDPPTELSLLSQSMMDQQALNELEASDEDDENRPGCSDYNVIRRVNIRKMKSTATGKVVRKTTSSIPVTPQAAGRAPDQAALNATVAVQRVRRSQNQPEESNEEDMISQVLNPEFPLGHSGSINSSLRKTKKHPVQSSGLDGSSFTSLSGDQSSLGMLQSMLGQVEADLDTFSPDTIPTSDHSSHSHRTKGLTGFSVALVSTLGRLVHLFKQNTEECQKAALERRQFEDQLKEQQELINALTTENMALREETAAFQARLQQQLAEIEQKVDTVVLVMGANEMALVPHQDPNIRAADPSRIVAERDYQQNQVLPAVLLSPPQQRDNWSNHVPSVHPVPAEILRSSENIKPQVSPSNLSSLPSTSSLSLSSINSKVSAEAMLAEIAQLSRQNELIRAQLSQARTLASAGSPHHSHMDERRLSCGSKGSPQSVVERRMSASSTKSVQLTETEQQAEESIINVNSVEQRLLELNRQSAAARSRLLELIDQQKQNASIKLSPSVSPVPPSVFSPVTESEASSVYLGEPILTNAEKRAASNELSPSQSVRSKASDSKTREQKQRTPEGWFSLSTHLR